MSSLTSTLRLQLLDAVSGPSKAAGRALKNLEGSIAGLGKNGVAGAKNLAGQLDHLRGKAEALGEFRGLRRGLVDAGLKLRTTRTNVQRLQEAITKAAAPTKKMEAELKAATTVLRQSEKAFTGQRTAIRAAEQALRAYGISSRADITRSQQEIRSQIAQTIRQMRTMDREARRTGSGIVPLRRRTGEPRNGRQIGLEVAGAVVGVEMTRGARNLVTESAHRAEAVNKIRNVSNSEEEVAKAEEIASEVSRAYPYTTQAQSLDDYAEQRSLAASEHPGEPIDYEKMRRNSMAVAKARAALASSGQEFGAEDVRSLMLALEGSGQANDPRAVENLLDAYVRAKQVGGTAIDPSKVRDFVANAKATNFSMAGGDTLLTNMARMFQGNASRLGNEFAQTMSTLLGGKMTKQGAQWLAKNGIIRPDQIRKGGGGKFFIAGGVKDKDLLSTDQTKWAQQVLFPAIEKTGALNEKKVKKRMELLRQTDPEASDAVLEEKAMHGLISDALQKSGFRQTVIDNLAHAIANQIITDKNVEMMKNTMGLDAANTIGQNPVSAMQEFMNSVANFGSVLTTPAMKDAGGILHSVASGISDLSGSLEQWQKDHPDMAKTAANAAPAALFGAGAWLTWKSFRAFFGGGGGSAGEAAGGARAAARGGLGLGTTAILGAVGVAGLAAAIAKYGPDVARRGRQTQKGEPAWWMGFDPTETREERLDRLNYRPSRGGPLRRGRRDRGEIEREISMDEFLRSPPVAPAEVTVAAPVTTQPSGVQKVEVTNPSPAPVIQVTVHATSNDPQSIADATVSAISAKLRALSNATFSDGAN
ncbi:hypothetical protein [Mesorhizobium sp. KR1-2]|uniref:hypothetical protein n=1 Tax=Mesorhizobium sp. KR1-2 TaxID=3156609 RepID=UPI0032B3F35D